MAEIFDFIVFPFYFAGIMILLCLNMEKRKKAFADGYKDLPSAKTIEDYFYNEDFKKLFYKKVVDYIDKNLDQFVRE